MPKRIPADLRPKAFAAVELVLDVFHALRSIADVDVEGMIIYLCVADATMRPLMLSPDTPPEMRLHSSPDEAYRGSISKLMVADKLNLPRETVRRKIKAMVQMGMLLEGADGKVRTIPNMADAEVRRAATASYAAVGRYLARLNEFGVPEPAATSKKSR